MKAIPLRPLVEPVNGIVRLEKQAEPGRVQWHMSHPILLQVQGVAYSARR